MNKNDLLKLRDNATRGAILLNVLLAAVSLFVNGFGIHLTIRASIGAAPWDVFSLGLSHTLGILYGTASVIIAVTVLLIDVLLKEPIGLAMFIDAVLVGKSVDFFNWLDIIPTPRTIAGSIVITVLGLFIIGYTQATYMMASLGCGPRDTLLVGLKKRLKKLPIGLVSILMLAAVTAIGYLLGGPVGIGTLICAFCAGPIMQFAFRTLSFDAVSIRHQHLLASLKVLFGKKQPDCAA